MSKKLKLSFILILVLNAICIAWMTFVNFFGGAGINFVAMLCVVGILAYIIVTDKTVRSRIMDMFVLSCLFTVLEFVIYCSFEFGWYTASSLNGFLIYQHVISIIAIFFLCYVLFRFFSELSEKRFKFIEIILGNEKPTKRVKENKELANGSLEEKPNHAHATERDDENLNDATGEDVDDEEIKAEINIETEEE